MSDYEPMDVEQEQQYEPMDVDNPTYKFIISCHGKQIYGATISHPFYFQSISFFVESGTTLMTDVDEPLPEYICQHKFITETHLPVNNTVEFPPLNLWVKPNCVNPHDRSGVCDPEIMRNTIGVYICDNKATTTKLLSHQQMLNIPSDPKLGILPGIMEYINNECKKRNINQPDTDLALFVCRGNGSGKIASPTLAGGSDKRSFDDSMQGQPDQEQPVAKKTRLVSFKNVAFKPVSLPKLLEILPKINTGGGKKTKKRKQNKKKTKKRKQTKKKTKKRKQIKKKTK